MGKQRVSRSRSKAIKQKSKLLLDTKLPNIYAPEKANLKYLLQRIKVATNADLITFYHTLSDGEEVLVPPNTVGRLFHPAILKQKGPSHRTSIVVSILEEKLPIFLDNATVQWKEIYRKKMHIELPEDNFVFREKVLSSAALPILGNDEALGLLFLNYRRRFQFDAERVELIKMAAGVLGAALLSEQNMRERTRIQKEQDVIIDIVNSITKASTWNVPQLLERIRKETSRILQVKNFYVAIKEENRLTFPLALVNNKRVEGTREYKDRRFGRGLTENVISSGTSLLIKEGTRPWRIANQVEKIGDEAKSWLGAPLIINENTFGVIAIQDFKNEFAYSERDRQILETIAKQSALALENSRLYNVYRRNTGELKELTKLVFEIGASDISKRPQAIVAAATDLTGAPGGKLYLLNHSDGLVHLKASKGVDNSVYPIGSVVSSDKGMASQVIKTGKTQITSDYSKYKFRIPELASVFGSVIEVPLMINNEIIGVLAVFDPTKTKVWTKAKTEPILMRLAPFAALASRDIGTIERIGGERELFRTLYRVSEKTSANFTDLHLVLGDITKESLSFIEKGKQKAARSWIGLLNENSELIVYSIFPKSKFSRIRTNTLLREIDPVKHKEVIDRILYVKQPQLIYLKSDSNSIYKFVLVIPIVVEDELFGALCLETPERIIYSEEEAKALQFLITFGGYAIRAAEAFARMEEIRAEEADLAKNALGDTRTKFGGPRYYRDVAHFVDHLLQHIKLTLDFLYLDDSIKKLKPGQLKKIERLTESVMETGLTIKSFIDQLGSTDQPKEELQLYRVVNQVSRLVDSQLTNAHIDFLIYEKQVNLPPIRAIRTEIVSAIYSVVNNSIEALVKSQQAEKKISATIRMSKQSNEFIQVVISDNGPGMDSQTLAMVRGDSQFSTKAKEGRGLGVSGSRAIVQKNGGTFEISSKLGRGTTVTITMPTEYPYEEEE